MLAYRAGLRASEVGLLQLRDYDPKADRIFIHRLKGSNSGHHHLVREEARALRPWLKVRGSFPGPDLPFEAEAADRPHNASSADEEVRRRGRHPGEAPPFPRVKALLRHPFIEQGIRRGAGPGLDRTREHSIDHGIRQGNECQEGGYGAAVEGDVAGEAIRKAGSSS